MVAPLRVGLAGLGNVGAAVIRLIETEQQALLARCGRPIEVAAVCARSKGKDRGVNLQKFRWHDDPLSLARDPDIDVFVELMGGEGFVRIALVENEQRIRQAARNIRRFLESGVETLHNVVPLATRR